MFRLKLNRPLRVALAINTALISILILGNLYMYNWADSFLDSIDLQDRSVSGPIFFASPKQLFVDQVMSRDEVISHLRSTDFAEARMPNQPGTFVREGKDVIYIYPRWPEFRPVILRFSNKRIAEIKTVSENNEIIAVRQALIEPEMLGSFVSSIKENGTESFFVRRYVIQWSDVAETKLAFAITAKEDRSFWSHNGISYKRMVSAFWSWLKGDDRGGASTITMQVVKNAISLDWRKSAMSGRKLREIYISAALESKYNKETIFTLYANSVYLGKRGYSHLYGLAAGAEGLFGKREVRDLTLAEASALACLLDSGGNLAYEDENNYKALKDKRDTLLNEMHRQWPDRFTASDIEAAKRETIKFADRTADQGKPLDFISRTFVGYANASPLLSELKSLPPTEYAGLRIYCSLDPDLMRTAHRAVRDIVPRIEAKFPAKGGCASSAEQHKNRMLATIIALDPRTGRILTMYGGSGGEKGSEDAKFAINALCLPASIAKTFWQAKAFDERVHLSDGQPLTPASVVDPSRVELEGWKPETGIGGPGRSRHMLSLSRNDYAALLVRLIGMQAATNTYRNLTDIYVSNPSGAMSVGLQGDMRLSALRVARAYTVFGRNGTLIEPTPFNRVYLDGVEREIQPQPTKRIFGEKSAYLTFQMMRSVLGYGPDGQYGTLRAATIKAGLLPERVEMGAKSGSGPGGVWVVSASSNLVVAVLITYLCPDEVKFRKGFEASSTAALLWSEFMKSVKKYRPDLIDGKVPQPDDIIERRINLKGGCVSDGLGGFNEYFIKGTQPDCSRDLP